MKNDTRSGVVRCFKDSSLMPASTAMADRLSALGFKRSGRTPSQVTTTRVENDEGEVVAIRIRVETSGRTDETARLERNGWAFPENTTVVEI